jgi:uncharacterized membrane protein
MRPDQALLQFFGIDVFAVGFAFDPEFEMSKSRGRLPRERGAILIC